MRKLKVAALQFKSTNSYDRNIEKIDNLIRQAKKPELTSSSLVNYLKETISAK